MTPCRCPHCGTVSMLPYPAHAPSVAYWCEGCGVALVTFRDGHTSMVAGYAGHRRADPDPSDPVATDLDEALLELREKREEWFHRKGWYG